MGLRRVSDGSMIITIFSWTYTKNEVLKRKNLNREDKIGGIERMNEINEFEGMDEKARMKKEEIIKKQWNRRRYWKWKIRRETEKEEIIKKD